MQVAKTWTTRRPVFLSDIAKSKHLIYLLSAEKPYSLCFDKEMPMRGQWLGSYSGSTDGAVMINIDEVDDHFEGVAYLNPSTTDIPASVAFLSTANKGEEQDAKAYIFPIDPRTGFRGDWEQIKGLYGEGVAHSSEAKETLI
ncbi:MAG: hypothetical protein GY848_14105 [Methyloversatilis sp.]|nr:hypothetical protein [Methyloversatilis sp.]